MRNLQVAKNEKAYLLFGLSALLAGLLFLFSPAHKNPTPQNICGEYIRINPHMGFISAIDAYEFCNTAQHPSLLLKAKTIRQNRPLYVLWGTPVGYFFQKCLDLAGMRTHRLVPFYAAFVLLNFLFLMSILALLHGILAFRETGSPEPMLFLAGALCLLFNPVVKITIWTAHVQILSIVMPLLALFLAQRLSEGRLARREAAIFLTAGLLPLAYGNMFLLFPPMAWSAFHRWRTLSPQGPTALVKLAGAGMLFMAPTLAWVAITTVVAGSYFNYEAAKFHQFVWMSETARIHWTLFANTLAGYARIFVLLSLKTLWPYLAVAWMLYTLRRSGPSPKDRPDDPGFMSGLLLVAFISTALFYGLMGLYARRLSFALAPLLIVWALHEAAGLKASAKERYCWIPPVLFGAAVIQSLWQVFSYGPFR
jgi:hypothetical protein